MRTTRLVHAPLGNLPFQYLGVPLVAKKFSYRECKPLVEKITARRKSWASKMLSYAGRIQLLKSVLQGIHSYWTQIFLLPKKVLREIRKVCGVFVWTGRSEPSRKAPLAWEQICLPKVAGGWNLLDVEVWNTAAIAKYFWCLAEKKDRLWIKWLHTYYIKQQDIWLPTTLSWNMRKILESRKHLSNAQLGQVINAQGKFSISRLYKVLRGDMEQVPWKRLVCHNKACPKSIFLLWLALHGRSATKDRLSRWGRPILPP